MKKSKFTEGQTAFAPQQAEHGTKVVEVCRKMGVSEQTFCRCKKKYGGMGPGELRRLKRLEEENRKLKRLVADLSLDKAMLRDVIAFATNGLGGMSAPPTGKGDLWPAAPMRAGPRILSRMPCWAAAFAMNASM